MPYVDDGRKLIQHAYNHGYTLPAFNICSVEMLRACLEAADELDAPVIVQTYPADIEQVPPKHMAALVKSFAEGVNVPVLFHLDHGPSFEMAMACLRAGYGSVMIDGAEQALDEIVQLAKKVSEIAHAQGASVEVAAESFNAGMSEYSTPEDCLRLKTEGEADMIAVSIGSEHGQSSVLKLELLADIASTVQGPLVVHGGSGISASDYAQARQHGIIKANIGAALYRTLRKTWEGSASYSSHREVYAAARAALKEVAKEKLHIMGAAGQALSYTP
ncbi:MAG: class II fructose-bisphosphate aldolase [Deinococcota bacterium]